MGAKLRFTGVVAAVANAAVAADLLGGEDEVVAARYETNGSD